MKVRHGFVSNSSSSSFMCDICHTVESGWDVCASEVGMNECQNGHTFCDEHTLCGSRRRVTPPSLEQKKKHLLADTDFARQIEEEGEDADIEDLYDEYVIDGVPNEECPFCSFNQVEDSYLLAYLLKQLGYSSKEDVIVHLKLTYESYEKFVESVK